MDQLHLLMVQNDTSLQNTELGKVYMDLGSRSA